MKIYADKGQLLLKLKVSTVGPFLGSRGHTGNKAFVILSKRNLII